MRVAQGWSAETPSGVHMPCIVTACMDDRMSFERACETPQAWSGLSGIPVSRSTEGPLIRYAVFFLTSVRYDPFFRSTFQERACTVPPSSELNRPCACWGLPRRGLIFIL
jgi:hypothetical protein